MVSDSEDERQDKGTEADVRHDRAFVQPQLMVT